MTELFTDRIISFTLERVGTGMAIGYDLAREIAKAFPEASGLSLVFALTSAASGLEDMTDEPKVGALYRLSAMVAADLFAFEARGEALPNGRALLKLWLTELPD